MRMALGKKDKIWYTNSRLKTRDSIVNGLVIVETLLKIRIAHLLRCP